jgi:hypothetical protein
MTERLGSMSDDRLGGALTLLDVEWPPTPELAPRVMAAVRADRRPRVVRLPLSRSKRILLIAAAIVLFLAGAAVAARLIIDLGAVVVEVTPGTPGPLPSPTLAPLGREITLVEARRILGANLPVPGRLGRPDGIWADEVGTDAGTVARITMAWNAGPTLPAIPGTSYGALLMRFEGRSDIAFKKVWEDDGIVEGALIHGTDGIWLSGTHRLDLLTSEGPVTIGVDGNVLLWDDSPYTMRLETTLPKAQAVRIASSATPGTS